MVDLDRLATTEARNPKTLDLDSMSPAELLATINQEDAKVAPAVALALPQIAQAVEAVTQALAAGGRLIYLGAGTSGRLGLLDAAECPPTFGVAPDLVVGLLAGGNAAFMRAVEGAEDRADWAVADLDRIGLSARDAVVGLAASGRTPYVIGGLDQARALGAVTIAIACNRGAEVSSHADIAIEVDNGPEILTGSTRLKAGTSQKLILNMISTAAMVRLGKVYGNLMVDLRPTNQKLVARAVAIVGAATGCDPTTAGQALAEADNQAKTAIVMLLAAVDADTARSRLRRANGFVRDAINPSSQD
ncbi:MAG: N-acetylmuramic acid 6-phosphate etherase [Propionibacteriaceae bacterium]|jgi:N-acetylmuramic acid 6-phosphate etherase|nr:N-acetylmuramic acid 6-phosphate etherase [Propionibacteriaceae bacterium]